MAHDINPEPSCSSRSFVYHCHFTIMLRLGLHLQFQDFSYSMKILDNFLHMCMSIEYLVTNRASHIFKHLQTSGTLCSHGRFSILDHASTSFQIKIKESLHIQWENSVYNKSAIIFPPH